MSDASYLAQQLRRARLRETDRAVNYAAITEPPMLGAPPKGLRRMKSDLVQLYTLPDFLDAPACAQLCALIDQHARPSTVAGDRRGGPREYADARRTSKSCDLVNTLDPVVRIVDRKIANTIGFDLSHSDAIQAQKYDPGEEFQPHWDYFEPGTAGYENFCAENGQRSWTFMIYLSDVEKGGGTVFPSLHRTIKPRLGMAVIWNNLTPDGAVNPSSLHGGAPVKAGVKYIITKWFRERGNGPLLAPAPRPD